jgi:polar amino acid transport system ATP-binding protein
MTNNGDGPAIRFTHCGKRFGDTVVLDDFSWDVAVGRRVAILGPSGSGKTTLLRLVMTIEQLDAGRIEVFGRAIGAGSDVPASERPTERQIGEVRRDVGMVFQQFNLFPHMTALQNVVEAPIRVLGKRKDEASEAGRALLRQVGLQGKEDAHPGHLSGGQQQRVAIARALAMEPRIMLFDEVTSALDPELVGEVLEVIRDLAEHSSMTMLLVTHEIGFARDVSDEVLFMEHGRVVESGPPQQVLSNPAEERTRSFLRAVGPH